MVWGQLKYYKDCGIGYLSLTVLESLGKQLIFSRYRAHLAKYQAQNAIKRVAELK